MASCGVRLPSRLHRVLAGCRRVRQRPLRLVLSLWLHRKNGAWSGIARVLHCVILLF